jgi:hypothetical protein
MATAKPFMQNVTYGPVRSLGSAACSLDAHRRLVYIALSVHDHLMQ